MYVCCGTRCAQNSYIVTSAGYIWMNEGGTFKIRIYRKSIKKCFIEQSWNW